MRSFLFLITVLISFVGKAESCMVEVAIEGTIGPASLDYLERVSKYAEEKKCSSIFLKINTPGGNLQSTRLIVELIMNSPRPFICLVAPSGGRAGSAGAIILQACHINGALEATNIGAATPISGAGQDLQKDLRKKMVEDTQSWVEGMARFYGRNEELVGKLVTEAKSFDARSAKEKNIVDYVGYTEREFLNFTDGRSVKMKGGVEEKLVLGGAEPFEPDMRYKLLSFTTDPQWSYLMFMGSLGLLYFEITHPGAIVPGVLGAVGLIIALISFHKLQVFWGGVALILLGLGLVAAEFFVVSMGVLAISGVISFILGSVFLFDFEATGVRLPLSLILTVSGTLLALVFGLSYLAYKTLHISRRRFGTDKFIGSTGVVTELTSESGRKGWVRVEGEVWKFKSKVSVQVGDTVRVEKVKGFSLNITKE